MEKIKCYLCGEDAIEKDYGTSGDVKVNCPNCPLYILTDRAKKFYFNPDATKVILNDKDKEKLRQDIQKENKPDIYVKIDTARINKVTGKWSKDYR